MRCNLIGIVFVFFLVRCSTNNDKPVFIDRDNNIIKVIDLDSCVNTMLAYDSLCFLPLCCDYDSIKYIPPYTKRGSIENIVGKKLSANWGYVPESKCILILFNRKEKKVIQISRIIYDFSLLSNRDVLLNSCE